MTENETAYKKLCRLSVPRANVTERHELFPNGYDTKGVVTTEPFNIPFDKLRQLMAEGTVAVHLDRGLIETYDNGGSNSQTRHLQGFFESDVEGKKVSGIMIGDLVGLDANNAPRKEYVLKNKDYIKVLEAM
jgi:hypothetical protein